METKNVICKKCKKPFVVKDGDKNQTGYLCPDCVMKSKVIKLSIYGIILAIIVSGILWLINKPEKVEGLVGSPEIKEEVVLDVSSQPFNIANINATNNNDISSQPIDNIESLRKAFESAKQVAEEKYSSANDDASKKAISLAIPRIVNYFLFNSSSLSYDSKLLLSEFASIYLQTNKESSILIEGFACNIGTNEINDKISSERANAVKNYLVADGIPSEKIVVKAHGKRKNSEFNFNSIAEYRRVLITIQ